MNSLLYKASEFQGEVFALSISNAKCSSLYFMRRFLISNTIKFLDQDIMNFALNSAGYIIYNLSNENKSIQHANGKKLPFKIMYWIGFMYRFICGYKSITSKHAYRMIKPEKMVELYNSLHTQSPEYATNYIVKKYFDNRENDINRIKKIYGLS